MSEFIPESYFNPLDLTSIFGRSAPLQVDLGCGDGSFLAALAKETPDHNFLGLERLAGRVRSAARKAAPLANVRILRIETAYAVKYLLPPDSVHAFHLLFPDPWPKRRHHARRIFTSEFLEALLVSLSPGSSLHLATDQPDYFGEMERLTSASKLLEMVPRNGGQTTFMTTFEKRFVAAGLPIYRLELRKSSAVIKA